jgi:hypothetical protein
MSEANATHRLSIGYVLVGLGALLIIVGTGLTVWQFWIIADQPAPEFPLRGIRATPTSLSMQTTYIGAILISIGALLAVAACFLFRGPRNRPRSN